MADRDLRALLVEDNAEDALMVSEALRTGGLGTELRHTATLAEGLEALEEDAWDVVLLDLALPDAQGLDTVRRMTAAAGPVPIVVLTAHDDEELAVRAVQQGAQDYLVKGLEDPARLVRSIRYAIERKRTESLLHASQAYVRSLTEKASDVVLILDLDARVRYVSRSIERVLGYRPEEREGSHALELVHPDDVDAVGMALAEGAREAGATARIETRVRDRGGAWVWIEATGVNLADDPAVRGILVTWRDISDRKAAEDALRESERRFRALIESAADAVLVLTAEAGLRYASPAGRRFVRGAVEGEPVPWEEVVHHDDLDRIRDAWRRVLEGGGPVEVEARVADGDRPWRQLELSLRDLLDVGGVEGVVVHARDVTERHDLEQRLREAQRLEAVGRLAGGIAHDFNNIVTGMKGFARLVLEEVPQDAPWRDDLEEVERLGERAADLTRQLLAFSRRQVLQPRVVDLGAVVDETQRMLRRVIGEDLTMVARLSDAPCRVRVDPTQIEQVVLNLVMNARDSMPRGGTLTLETGHARLDAEGARAAAVDAGPGTYAFVRVSDTGVGMTADVRKQAFEPFFTTKEPGRGTGLGLSTVFGIVKQSGGGVALESEPGRGTAVTVYLPPAGAAAADGAAEATSPTGDEAPAAGRVLVVEDDAAVRAIVERVLGREGFEVLTAPDGEEALRRLEADGGPIDLVVTDLVMPGMGGRELRRRLLADRPGLPVLLVSGYSGEEVARQGARETGEWFLEKPFTPERLLGVVRRILGSVTPRGTS